MTRIYNESFFIPIGTKPRNFPEYTKLRDIQYQPWQSETSGLMPSPKIGDISDPTNWSLFPQEKDITDAEGRALGDLVQLSTNFVLNNSWTGSGKDPSKAIFLRMLLDQEPLTEIMVSDTEVNNDGINKRQEQLRIIAESTPEILSLPETKKQALRLKQELNYIHRKQNQIKTRYSEFSTADFYRGQEGILGGVIQKLIANAYDVTNNRVFNLGLDIASSVDDILGTSLVPDSLKEMVVRPSTSTRDVENLVSRFDETFNYNRWFEDTIIKNDSFVAAGLLNAGISNETFALARNADHAHLMLANKLLSNHIDKRLSKYHPSSFQNLINFSTSIAQGFYNTGADIAVEAGAELAITGILALLPEPSTKVVAGAGAARLGTKAARLGNIFRRSFETTTYLAGVGDLPRYALSWGLLRRGALSFIPGAVGGGALSVMGQNNDIALANALYHYNPDMKSDFSWDEVVKTAALGGAFSAGLGTFFRLPEIGLTWSRNRQIKDMFYSAGFAPPKNLLQPYPWEITARNISSVFNRKPKVITEDPLLKTVNESLLQGTEPSLEQQNADARANAEAVSASRVVDNVENTTSIPEDLKIQRQDTEAPEQFINRFIFSSKTWDESSLTVLLDGLSPNKNFSKLTTREQFAVLLELEDFDVATTLDKVISDKRNETNLLDAEKETLDFLEKVVYPGLKKDLLGKSVDVIKKLSEQDQADVRKARAEGKPIGTRSVSSAKDLARSIFDSAVDSTVTGTTTPPKVSETKPTETDATVKTAEVTQEKINQVTEDAKEEIKASTAEELENNTENIQDNIRHKLFGGIEPKTSLKRLAATRQKKLGLSPEKQKKVLQVLQNPANFLKLAQGNTDYISDFFERIRSAELGYSKESVRIILAATVNLNWNSPAARKISQLNIVEAGKRSKVNALTGDVSIESKADDIGNLLHEIGHVFGLFDYSDTVQKIALQTNRSLIDLHTAVLGLDKVKDKATLRYFTANPDELYAQAFATLMLDRVRLSVFMKDASAKSPAIIKALQKTFEVVVESLLNIIDTLKLDKVYNDSTLLETVKRGIESVERSADPILTQYQYFRLVVNDIIEAAKNEKVKLKNIVEITDLADKLNSTIEKEIGKTIKKDPRFKTRKADKRLGDSLISQKFLFDSNEVHSLIGFIKQLGVSNRIELNIVVDAFIQTKIQGLSTDNISRFNAVFLENLKTNQIVFNTVVFNFLKDMAALGNKEAKELDLTSIPVGKEKEIAKLLSKKISGLSEVTTGDDLAARPTFRFATLDETISYFQDRQIARKKIVEKQTETPSIKIQTSLKPQMVEKPGRTLTPVNVWFGTGENSILSNLAFRRFVYEGNTYWSVEHAYQSLRSGKFDRETWAKYNVKAGIKIRGNKGTKTKGNWNIQLMERLMRESFLQNLKAAEALKATEGRKITHTQDRGVWKTQFPRLLEKIRDELIRTPSKGLPPTRFDTKSKDLLAPPRTPGDDSFLAEAVSEKKPLSSMHWYGFEGNEYSKEEFLSDVEETAKRMPAGVRYLLVSGGIPAGTPDAGRGNAGRLLVDRRCGKSSA